MSRGREALGQLIGSCVLAERRGEGAHRDLARLDVGRRLLVVVFSTADLLDLDFDTVE